VSLDWKWLFIYPAQGIATVNRLVVPAGVPVHFSLTSSSVMNTFFVPQLGSQIYTMNGMRSQLWLQADRPGTFYGQSGHFSGDGFPDMNFAVQAVAPAQFNGWAAAQRGVGPVLDTRGYVALAKQSQKVHPFGYRAVQSGLFDAVVMQKIPPAAGPQVGRGGPHTSPGDAT
jgi:cytochrome o ubiquinol oxidase subunit 2